MRLVSAFRMLAFVFVLLAARQVVATPLSFYIDNNLSITVGDKQFDQFSYIRTGDMPDASNVNVLAYTDPNTGDFGLLFQGAFHDFFGGGASDALLGFRVSVLNANEIITGATLTGNPNVVGGNGFIAICETFLPENPFNVLEIYDIKPGSTKLTDSESFNAGYSSLHVQKDIMAFAAEENGGIPTLSFFTQTFHQDPIIPEPASMTLLGMGLVGLCVGYRYRRVTRRNG